MQSVRRIMVLLCSLLIAAPIGWCCWIPVVHGGEKEDVAHSCCSAKQKPTPAKPQEAPQPSRSCCCDPLLISSAAEVTGKDPLPILPAVLASPASLAAISSASAHEPPSLHDPSPPLHILHCVWLC